MGGQPIPEPVPFLAGFPDRWGDPAFGATAWFHSSDMLVTGIYQGFVKLGARGVDVICGTEDSTSSCNSFQLTPEFLQAALPLNTKPG